MTVTVPESHRDLLEDPICVTLVTVMPDGMPQASVVWWLYRDGMIEVEMGADSQKARNLRRHPKAAFTVIDPNNPYRYVEVRAEMTEIIEHGGAEFLDEQAIRYTGKKYYGEVVPESDRANPGIIVRFKPTRIRAVTI